jgi:fatty acid desaturase
VGRSEAAPYPAELTHLRPTDAQGMRIVIAAAAGTGLALGLSFAGNWILWAAGQLLLALMLLRWFVILHECGHDTLFRTRRWHSAAGWIAGFFSLIPWYAWVRVHGRHHKWTGWQDLDPTTESLVPKARGGVERALVNICWRLWVPLFSVLYRLTNYWHVPRLLRLFPSAADRRRLLRDIAILIGVYALLVWILGPATLVRACGPALLLTLMTQDLLLLSQHTHVPQHVSHGEAVKPFPSIEQEPFTRSLRLPPPASRFLLHFDAHELHHMYPFVPGYHLRHIPYTPENEIGWWHWVAGAKRVRGDVLLFQNRLDTGYDL